MPEDDPEKIDINLDEEPVATPDEAARALGEAMKAAEVAAPDASGQAVAQRLATLQAEKDQLLNTLIRRQADFDNYKKRMDRERAEDRQRATILVIEQLLPVLDAFERALAAHADAAYEEYRKGFELIYRQILDALSRYGLEPIAAVGAPFDPNIHHAVDRIESADHDDGTVVLEHQRGYRLRDTVLRPAMVRVAFRPESEGAPTRTEPDSPVN